MKHVTTCYNVTPTDAYNRVEACNTCYNVTPTEAYNTVEDSRQFDHCNTNTSYLHGWKYWISMMAIPFENLSKKLIEPYTNALVSYKK